MLLFNIDEELKPMSIIFAQPHKKSNSFQVYQESRNTNVQVLTEKVNYIMKNHIL